jgi:cytochrome oxidase Cu insertion factor (SCO1/SenC/PrrC family)
MRLRPALLLLVAAALMISTLTGCNGGGADANESDTVQDGLEVGAKAPDFRLKNQDQETIALSDYLGTKNVILVFYPADFTPV